MNKQTITDLIHLIWKEQVAPSDIYHAMEKLWAERGFQYLESKFNVSFDPEYEMSCHCDFDELNSLLQLDFSLWVCSLES